MSREGYKMTELGEIPQEWEVKAVEELINQNIILDVLDGNHGAIHPKSSDYVESGVPFIMANNIVNNKVDLERCKFISKEQSKVLKKGFATTGDVLLTHKGTVGLTAIVPESNNEYIVLTPQVTYYRIRKNNEVLLNTYLKFYFEGKAFQDILSSVSAQSTRDYIGITAQKKLNVILPSFAEQQKIADILSTIDEQIEQTDSLIEKTKELKKGLMQRLLTKGIGHTEFKNTEFGEIPVEWEVKSNFIRIKSGYGFKFSEYTPNGIPLIRINNVMYGKITDDDMCYLPQEYLLSYKEFVLTEGDILLALNRPVTNNNLKIGKILIEPAILYQRVGKLEFDNSKYFPEFYYHYLQSKFFINILETLLVGSDQPYIKTTEFMKILFPVPTIYEQMQIAEILSTIDSEIECLEKRAISIHKAKAGLMQQLLTGKTRVKI